MIATAKMTGAEFDALPFEEGRHVELLEGELVEVSRANAVHQNIVLILAAALLRYFLRERTGYVYTDIEFAMGPNLRLAPDIAILLGDKWRTLDPHINPLLMSPDIAVEVISPSERTVDSTRKVRLYLKQGVTEVWQVFPEDQEILIHRTGPTISVLTSTDHLETPLLPDLSLPLTELFSL